MKVISLLQPWATLVVIGAKKIETRSWNTKFRGEILIHASKKLSKEQKRIIDSGIFRNKLKQLDELQLGKIIGKVELVDTVQFKIEKSERASSFRFGIEWPITNEEKAFGDYSPGRYGWLLSDPIAFNDHHYQVKGSLGLWDFNQEICLQCGCTGEDACVHPDFGPCWWVEPYLCSHCAEGVNTVRNK